MKNEGGPLKLLLATVCLISNDSRASLFQDFKRVMTGQQQKSPRWKKCTESVTMDLETASGALYVDEHFDVTDKQEAVEMVKNLRDSFLEMLNQTDWMDNQTKTTAIEKVCCVIKPNKGRYFT
jgi:predicted metalloendopeptidase